MTPMLLNNRMAYQRGTCLCPSDINARFEENLGAFAQNEKPNTNV